MVSTKFPKYLLHSLRNSFKTDKQDDGLCHENKSPEYLHHRLHLRVWYDLPNVATHLENCGLNAPSAQICISRTKGTIPKLDALFQYLTAKASTGGDARAYIGFPAPALQSRIKAQLSRPQDVLISISRGSPPQGDGGMDTEYEHYS